MAYLYLLCLFDGECASEAVIVEISPSCTVNRVRNRMKSQLPTKLRNIRADQLSIWHVSITDETDIQHTPILLHFIDDKNILEATTKLSTIFPDGAPVNTIHFIVQTPMSTQSDTLRLENGPLQKQLKQTSNSTMSFRINGLIGLNQDIVDFSWCTTLETATVDDLKKHLHSSYPKYACDEKFIQIFVPSCISNREYDRHRDNSEVICNDDKTLRAHLGILAKRTSDLNLTIFFRTPSKNFSFRTYEDVCHIYGHKGDSASFPQCTDIQTMALNAYPDPNLRKQIQDHVLDSVKSNLDWFCLLSDPNQATRAAATCSFLRGAEMIFGHGPWLRPQGQLSGTRGYGPVHISITSYKHFNRIVGGVTVVRGGKADFEQGIVQNIAQLESAVLGRAFEQGIFQDSTELKAALAEQNQARGAKTIQKAYGIVTDAESWAFLECTLNLTCELSIRMSMLDRKVDYRGR